MTEESLFRDLDLARLHDIVWEITDLQLTTSQLLTVFNSFPRNLKFEALQWGLDTVVGDEMYTYIVKNGLPKELTDAESSKVS